MSNNRIITLLIIAIATQLSACTTHPAPANEYAQKSRIERLHSAAMTDTCIAHAATRYNTLAQRIKVLGVDAWQGSYEMRGYTPRQEDFTCSFDDNGEFLYLSMR